MFYYMVVHVMVLALQVVTAHVTLDVTVVQTVAKAPVIPGVTAVQTVAKARVLRDVTVHAITIVMVPVHLVAMDVLEVVKGHVNPVVMGL